MEQCAPEGSHQPPSAALDALDHILSEHDIRHHPADPYQEQYQQCHCSSGADHPTILMMLSLAMSGKPEPHSLSALLL
jgi:hypothetical protein